MQLIHRVSVASTPDIRRELASLGIFVAPSTGPVALLTFEVDETSASWPALQEWIRRRRAADFVSTKFSRDELAHAQWLQLLADWHHGYPQPNEDSFGYLAATYDLTNYCVECGTGLEQKAPFQMKAEPKWGRRDILQLNWVFDEYFVTPDAMKAAFEPHRIGSRPVLNTKGEVLKTVVQVVIAEEVGIDVDGLPRTTCASCGRVKYTPVHRGPFSPLKTTPSASAVKTTEYFGSGASAHRAVLISRELADTIEARNIRGASLRPVMRPT